MNPVGKLVALIVIVFLVAPNVIVASTDINQLLSQLETQYGIPQGCMGKIAKAESGGNPKIVNPTSTKAAGLFQWIEKYWYGASAALYGRSLPASYRFDPVEASKVTAFTLGQAKSQLGGLISQAKIDPCLGLYMSHFLGTAGARKFLSAYIQNPGQNAAAIFPVEARANGGVFGNRTLSQVLNFLAGKLNVSGVLNVAGNFEDKMGVSYANSSANLPNNAFLPKNFQPPPSPEQRTYPTNYNSNTANSNTSSAGSATTSQGGESINQNAIGDSAALIVAQPSSVSKGKSIIVSWTSVRMSTTKACQVFLEASGGAPNMVAEGNEGTKIFPTTEGAATGTWYFYLRCTTAAGETLERDTTVVVQ